MKIFTGFIVALELDSRTKAKKKLEIKKLITDNDGQFSFVLNKQCSLLVTNIRENAEGSYKCQMAIKNNIPVVSTDYLYDCIDQGKNLNFKPYQILADASTQHFNKGIISTNIGDESKQKVSNVLKVYRESDSEIPYFNEDSYEVLDHGCFESQRHGKKTFSVVELHASTCCEDGVSSDCKMKAKIFFRILLQSGQIAQNDQLDERRRKKEFRFTDNSDVAMATFLKLCQQQTEGSAGMTRIPHLPHKDVGSGRLQMKMKMKKLLEHPGDREVANLVEEIWGESVGCLDKMVLPKSLSLKLDEIGKAESLLVQLKRALQQDGGRYTNTSEDLEREFYQAVPHQNEARERLNNKKSVIKKLELCQLLRDLVSVSENTGYSRAQPMAAKYRALRCAIKTLNGEEFESISDFVTNSASSELIGVDIKRIFKVDRPTESLNFASHLSNIKMMFHATKPENVLGILSRGLLLPRVVVTELGGSLTDVGRLGGGIYFANSVSTSLKYSKPSKGSGTRFMFLLSVALGLCKDFLTEDPSLMEAPTGFNSCHAVGKTKNQRSVFEDDEYVIYSSNQQRLEYLIEFNMDEDHEAQLPSHLFSMAATNEKDTKKEEVLEDLEKLTLEDILSLTNPIDDVKAGLIVKGSNKSVPLKSVHVFVKMIDLVAQVTVLQVYQNERSTGNREVKYVFPLDEEAAVYAFEAFIGDKHVIGKVKEKEQARREYKEAVSKGHGAYLMDQDEQVQNLFVISVGNLPPRVEVLIKVTYVTQLSVEREDVCLNLPTCVAPWKENEVLGFKTQDFMETLSMNPSQLRSTSIQVSIEMPFVIKRISSPTHNIRFKKTDTKAVAETIRNHPLNAGFKLLVTMDNLHMPRMWVEQDEELCDSKACMLTFYPEFESTTLTNHEVVFLLDQSNSMFQSRDIISARKILLLFLKQLPNESLFNIILFGSDFSKLFSWCKPKTQETMEDANNYLKSNTKSMGRSTVNDLFYVFHLLNSPTTTRNIIIITDGYLDDEADVFRRVKSFTSKTRLFGIGVGDAANNHFLQNLARVGRGCHEHFDNRTKSKWIVKVQDILDKMVHPSVSKVAVEWQNFGETEDIIQAPSNIASIFSGSRQVVFGFVSNCTMATLKANICGHEISTVVSTSDLNTTTGAMIHKLTARAVIQDWLFGMMAQDRLEDEVIKRMKKNFIINLSIKHSIVTKYTSFVAIEEREKDEEHAGLQIDDHLDKNTVDFLPYMGWQPTECRVNMLRGDGSLLTTVECTSVATMNDLSILLSNNIGEKFVLRDPYSLERIEYAQYGTVWDCLAKFPGGLLCSMKEDENQLQRSKSNSTCFTKAPTHHTIEEYEFERDHELMDWSAEGQLLGADEIYQADYDDGDDEDDEEHEEEEESQEEDHGHDDDEDYYEGWNNNILMERKAEAIQDAVQRSFSDVPARMKRESHRDGHLGPKRLVQDPNEESEKFPPLPPPLPSPPGHQLQAPVPPPIPAPVFLSMQAPVPPPIPASVFPPARATIFSPSSSFSAPCAPQEVMEQSLGDSAKKPAEVGLFGSTAFGSSQLFGGGSSHPQFGSSIQTDVPKLNAPAPLGFFPSETVVKDYTTTFGFGSSVGTGRAQVAPSLFQLAPPIAPSAYSVTAENLQSEDMQSRELESEDFESEELLLKECSANGPRLTARRLMKKKRTSTHPPSPVCNKGGIKEIEVGSHMEEFGFGLFSSEQVQMLASFQEISEAFSMDEGTSSNEDYDKTTSSMPELSPGDLEFKERLLALLQKDDVTGFTFWELSSELSLLLEIDNFLVTQNIIAHFSHLYDLNAQAMKDLARLYATLISLKKILDKIAPMMKVTLEFEKIASLIIRFVPLKDGQNLLTACYFCLDMLTHYPGFENLMDKM